MHVIYICYIVIYNTHSMYDVCRYIYDVWLVELFLALPDIGAFSWEILECGMRFMHKYPFIHTLLHRSRHINTHIRLASCQQEYPKEIHPSASSAPGIMLNGGLCGVTAVSATKSAAKCITLAYIQHTRPIFSSLK